jgi:hypothetical protein
MAIEKLTPSYRPPPTGPEGRGYVSPLGGAVAPFSTDNQIRQERRNRAQSPRPSDMTAPVGARAKSPSNRAALINRR